MFETGWFSTLWSRMARKLGPRGRGDPGRLAPRRRRGRDRGAARRRQGPRDQGRLLRAQRDLDRRHVRDRGREARDRQGGHPALLLVDTISSLGSIDYRHDEWGVDVTVGGSQKG
jgi:alanine-glyoxylate transaminase/serine-glyoxylate transaminase/serine-pyruvate transaminase